MDVSFFILDISPPGAHHGSVDPGLVWRPMWLIGERDGQPGVRNKRFLELGGPVGQKDSIGRRDHRG